MAVAATWSIHHGDTPGTAGAPAPATSSTTGWVQPTPSEPGTRTDAQPTPTRTTGPAHGAGDARRAAVTFMHTWGQRTLGKTAWAAKVRPLCDPRGWFLMDGTDPANIPAFTVQGTPMITPDAPVKTIQVSVRTNIGSALITFVHGPGGRLLMHNFVVPGGTS